MIVTLCSDVPVTPQSRNDICARKLSAWSRPVHADTSCGTGVNPLIIGVYAAFVNINNLCYTQNEHVNYERPNIYYSLDRGLFGVG